MSAESLSSQLKKWSEQRPVSQKTVEGDDFLRLEDFNRAARDAALRSQNRVIAELKALAAEMRWEEMVSLFHPVSEKCPEAEADGAGIEIRSRLAFALGQMKRFDDAISELEICTRLDPSEFHHASSLAYTAYNSLYAAKNREIVLAGKARSDRILMAHLNFRRAQELRPDGVTNYYRQGMLYKQIEGKVELALPLFERAVANWERLDPGEREARHQERKNYVKGLYQLAACLLDRGRASRALEVLRRCLTEDESSNYLSLVFKYYALGKVNYHLDRYKEARDALLFALKSGTGQPVDFVYELLARTYLGLDNPGKAKETIDKVPERMRRPYYRWTEADVLCVLGRFDEASRVLERSVEGDGRSRHKSLVMLAKIAYLTRDYAGCLEFADRAEAFFSERWNGQLDDALFWKALSAFRLGRLDEAGALVDDLSVLNPRYPKLAMLRGLVNRLPGNEDRAR